MKAIFIDDGMEALPCEERLPHQGVLKELLAWSGFPAAWQLSLIFKGLRLQALEKIAG